jgi:hypothetical protein
MPPHKLNIHLRLGIVLVDASDSLVNNEEHYYGTIQELGLTGKPFISVYTKPQHLKLSLTKIWT